MGTVFVQRRKLLALGALGTVALGAGVLTYRYLPPRPSANPGNPMAIASRLLETLTTDQRAELLVPYDHPLRQYHNRGVWAGGPTVATAGFDREQLQLVTDLMYAGLSPAGRAIVPNQFYLKLPDVLINNLLICGEPESGSCQVLFSGPHLNLRIGGANREGVAFGGPQVYGDQRGNEEPGIPGNVYEPQLKAGMALLGSLSPGQRMEAILPESPIQTQIEVQGAGAALPGLPVRELNRAQQQQVEQMISLTLAPYPAEDVAYARRCLAANGGLDAFSVSFYEDSRYEGSSLYQTYRLESPAAVFYFRGFPHVHAFFNIAMDGSAPLSVGALVGSNPGPLESLALKALFERAMAARAKADFGFYDRNSVVGRLRAGQLRSGDIYNAESWQNELVVLSVRGSELAGELRGELEATGSSIDPDRRYRVATTDHVAENRLLEGIGDGEHVASLGPLRDHLVSHLTAAGFA